MNNNDLGGVSTVNNALKWGGYTAIALILFDLILYVTGMKDPAGKNPIQYLGFLVFIVMIVMTVKAYKESNGVMSLGQAIGTGMIASIVASILVGIYIIVFMKFIDPTFIDTMKDAQREAMLASGDMTEEQYESMKGVLEAMFSPGAMFIMSAVMYGILGLITSLISGLIMKNNS